MWAYSPKKSPTMLICGIPLPKMGIFPSAIFTKFCLGEGAPRPHPPAKFSRCSFKNVALRLQKSPKMVIFGKNLRLEKKLWGSIGKLEHRCTTTNLPLCNDTIIVFYTASYRFRYHKLRHSKAWQKNRQTNKTNKQTSHFFIYSRRVTHNPHHTWHGDRGGPSCFCNPPP